ncbi:3-methyladenine DNA glycosylase [Corynebacterium tapiri]|uniref:3-methyladenine DNA glycosylase n=1 Tax=Corynebacterium tapiri TaxID=1448266 RepID=A0A5C4U5P7_9CORY|nr:3-methyladenine DNA glycosylase [Corynebacterium tapiri]TNL97639.1 3-methyladenine DNA glycosylase [Corynebacterium tapiri]
MQLTQVLPYSEWSQRAQRHYAAAEERTQSHLQRRSHGQKHPVFDFLFEYYPFRPAHLKRWHPGAGIGLLDAPVDHFPRGYLCQDGVTYFDVPAFVERQRGLIDYVVHLQKSTEANPASFDCFGLHEWAMVYRTDRPRHDLPLRLSAEETNKVVETHRIKCTHYDAFRFFTPAARPLNLTILEREDQPRFDQAGCIHATMDLYKWAAKLAPLVGSELMLEAFDLATRARIIDMEASPYDCRSLGLGVIAIETPDGKAEYVAQQRSLAESGRALRTRLVRSVERVLKDYDEDI